MERRDAVRRGLALVAALALAVAPARAAWHAHEEIAVESPLYAMLDALVTQYGAPAGAPHTRPWTREDLGRFLDALRRTHPGAASDPAFARLERELAPGTAFGQWESAGGWDDDTRSIEASPYLRLEHREDRARAAVVREHRVGVQLSAMLGPSVLLWTDLYAGTTSPGPHGNPADSRRFGLVEGVQVNSYYDRATAVVAGTLGRLTLGHTWLRWGPGAFGTMALSDGAPAFDLAEVRVPLATRALLTWTVAALETRDESFLAGHRLEVRATDRVIVSFSELARFDGVSNLPLYLLPVVPFSLAEKRVQKPSALPSDSLERLAKNNVLWAADVAWVARPGLRFWGELALDDVSISSERRPLLAGWQAGAQARRVRGPSAWSLTGEYARVYDGTYSVYHRHDFVHGGLPTGFPLGPDVERADVKLTFTPDPDWTWGLELRATRKGEGRVGDAWVPGTPVPDNLVLRGVVDRERRVAASLEFLPAPGVRAGVLAGWSDVRARDHRAGDHAAGILGAARLDLRW